MKDAISPDAENKHKRHAELGEVCRDIDELPLPFARLRVTGKAFYGFIMLAAGGRK